MASVLSPLRQGYKYLQYLAHDQPVIFFSCVIGITGPVLALSVPPIRRNYFGFVPSEPVPTTYPVPKRPRRPVQGYEDE
ncbi:N19M, NADH-ubiquinone oxidoreductase 9.5 kDa subunit [Phlebopus sp. FC_14]|nr:N19M, NADH-ubiquinone oxidoreductase 9.5 kDa subunit [Phlebopus sp. FC_14]